MRHVFFNPVSTFFSGRKNSIFYFINSAVLISFETTLSKNKLLFNALQ